MTEEQKEINATPEAPTPQPAPEASASQGNGPEPPKKQKRHWIKTTWLRRTLKTLLGVIIFILAIPVLLYIPPVQDFAIWVAESVVKDSTGMDVKIGHFRLKFPLDVSLGDLSVVEADGDTLVSAKEAVADVKLLPLFKLDVKINRLRLEDAYYRLVSADTSMIMTIKAGYLEVDDKSQFLVKQSDLTINKATIRDANIQMYSDVWRAKPKNDTTPSPLRIAINDLQGERVRFGMSSLPTIDTLAIYTQAIELKNGIIDLGTSKITADELTADNGDVKYIFPTPEYVRTHPAPKDTTPSKPMTIEGKKVVFDNFNILYAMDGARPKPGFDSEYLQLSSTSLDVDNFYNRASELKVPLQSLKATERCGLQITQGSGYIGLDSTGIYLDKLNVLTPYSRIDVTAGLPFSLLEFKPYAPVDVSLNASLGQHDITAFMPDASSFTKFLPKGSPVNVAVDATGTLSDISISKLDVALPSTLSLRASGTARNPLDFKKLVGNVKFDGELYNPAIIEKIAGKLPVNVPKLEIKGTASANHENFAADFNLLTTQGDLAAKGGVILNSEKYDAHLDVTNFDMDYFMPHLGIGLVNARLDASGNGFDPLKPKASTDIDLAVSDVAYKGKVFRNVTLQASLGQKLYDIYLNSPNPDADINLKIDGEIDNGTYSANGYIHCANLNLKELGLDTTTNYGSFDVKLDGSVSPANMLCNADITIASFDWNLPDRIIHLPADLNARLVATENDVALNIDCQQTSLAFNSPENLTNLISGFVEAASTVSAQVEEKQLMVDNLQQMLPKFDLTVHASGSGLAEQLLAGKDIYFNTLDLDLSNDTTITGDVKLLGLQTATMNIDTISLGLSQRNYLLDYKLHIGNQPGTFDELYDVNLNGYVGGNRLAAYLNQKNLKGETGYKVGFTAAISQDNVLSLHFTPLNAMIGYMPWTLNNSNYIDVNLNNYKITANLEAKSSESAIQLETKAGADDLQELDLKLTNIHLQDFMQMSASSPSLTATINANIRARYDGKEIVGMGRVNLSDLSYDNTKIDPISLAMQASMNHDGTYDVSASLAVDKKKALTVSSKLISGDAGLEPEYVKLNLNKFPLSVANAFLGNDVAQLQGTMSGEMDLSGGLTKPILNGSLTCDSVSVFLPIMGSALKFDTEPLTVTDNLIRFNNFDIWGANQNPLTIDGTIDARKLTDIRLDVTANANNFELINNDRRAKSDLYGKLFLNFNASAKGPMTRFDVNANLNILGSTDVYYTIPDANTAIETQKANDVVKFVNFADSVRIEEPTQESVFMRVNANVAITPGAMVTVNLSSNGTDKVQLQPSGNVALYRNFMGDITLNGQLFTGNGFARYNIPVIGEKEFVFDPSSYVLWNGPMMNPTLNIKATDTMKVSVSQEGGNSHLINFLVKLMVTGTLSSPGVLFDLATDDDITIENQLQSMSADQRNSAAMNLLITGQYAAGDISTNSGPLVGNVYNFLTQQLNSWAAKNIRGVDLSFGVNQYNMTNNGETSTTTSYSYQLSKSLFNNRFKISVGGNYSTDDSPDDNLTQNLISDISFEYIISQTQFQSMLVKLFRHNGYESILEGEITEMGAGFVYKRKIGDFKSFFSSMRKRKEEDDNTLPANGMKTLKMDSTKVAPSDTIKESGL